MNLDPSNIQLPFMLCYWWSHINLFIFLSVIILFYKFVVLSSGPFSDCHESVDPSTFYSSCIYDLCSTLPDDGNLCNNLEGYAGLCRERGTPPDDWRELVPQCRKETTDDIFSLLASLQK